MMLSNSCHWRLVVGLFAHSGQNGFLEEELDFVAVSPNSMNCKTAGGRWESLHCGLLLEYWRTRGH